MKPHTVSPGKYLAKIALPGELSKNETIDNKTIRVWKLRPVMQIEKTNNDIRIELDNGNNFLW